MTVAKLSSNGPMNVASDSGSETITGIRMESMTALLTESKVAGLRGIGSTSADPRPNVDQRALASGGNVLRRNGDGKRRYLVSG